MPTNLNALIRYKTIDRCLRNQYMKCTILRLREECTEAIGEKRGIYKAISERTIRDDIRVMRSDILGFNAPIQFKDGLYFYSDPFYTIFEERLFDKRALLAIYKLLIENADRLEKVVLNSVISKMASILKIELPDEISKDAMTSFIPSAHDNTLSMMSISNTEVSENIEREKSPEDDYNTEIRFMIRHIAEEKCNASELNFAPELSNIFNEPEMVYNEFEFPWKDIFLAVENLRASS